MKAKRIRELNEFAAGMKAKPTPSERLFAARLQMNGISHDAQVVIPPYIVDFLIHERRLVVEIDGSSHTGREGYDRARDAKLRKLGYEVVRIQNCDARTYDLTALFGFAVLPLPIKKVQELKQKVKAKNKKYKTPKPLQRKSNKRQRSDFEFDRANQRYLENNRKIAMAKV